MTPFYQTITDLDIDRDAVVRRRYGTIETAGGKFVRLKLRPLPKIVTAPGVMLLGPIRHELWRDDRCLLFYDQPARFPQFLALKYLISGRHASAKTVLRAIKTVERIAEMKGCTALLCDIAAGRLLPHVVERFGFEPHAPQWFHRNYIKRLREPSANNRFALLRDKLANRLPQAEQHCEQEETNSHSDRHECSDAEDGRDTIPDRLPKNKQHHGADR